jgi:hypothetical protein
MGMFLVVRDNIEVMQVQSRSDTESDSSDSDDDSDESGDDDVLRRRRRSMAPKKNIRVKCLYVTLNFSLICDIMGIIVDILGSQH